MKILVKYKKQIGQILTLLSICLVLFCYAGQKEGFHIDEILSYQLANAEFNPFVLTKQPVGRLAKFVENEIRGESFAETVSNIYETAVDLVKNGNNSKIVQYKADVYPEPVWIDSEQFVDYITADSEDAFNYLSVYFNTRADIHPPLYYMLLHTMSSLVQGSASPLLACTVNIVLVLCCCICLMKLAAVLEEAGVIPAGHGWILGITIALLYGFSRGAIATILLARMYALMTLFCVWSFYLHIRKWYKEGFAAKRVGLILVTAGGFLSQYFFVFFCVPLAMITIVLLGIRKRYKELWNYIVSMAVAAVLGIGLFPFCISDVFSSAFGTSVVDGMSESIKEYAVSFFALLDKGVSAYFGSYVWGIAITVCLVIAALWMTVKRRGNGEVQEKRVRRPFYMMWLVSSAGFLVLNSIAAPYWEARYLMPLFPFLAMGLAFLMSCILRTAKSNIQQYVMVLPAILFAIVCALTYNGVGMYKGYDKSLEIAKQYSDLNCVCVYGGDRYYENLSEFMQYDKTLITMLWELEQRQDVAELMEPAEMIVLRKIEVIEEDLFRVLQGYGWEVDRVLLNEMESPLGDTIYLCVRKQ